MGGVKGIQTWIYIYVEIRKYQVKHFIKGFYESFDMLHVETFIPLLFDWLRLVRAFKLSRHI